MARGYQVAKTFHEENNGLGYTPFTLKKDKDQSVVRVLQHQDQWVNLYMHQAYKKIKAPTRCSASWTTDERNISVEDRSGCPMCMAEVPRTMKTYIPVRVRGDENEQRVQTIVYGRDGLQELINQIEELPSEADITTYDFKIKRQGEGLDTKYFWMRQEETKRPLNDAEMKLEVPDMEEVISLLDEGQLLNRAQQYIAAESAQAVEPSNGNGRTKTPF